MFRVRLEQTWFHQEVTITVAFAPLCGCYEDRPKI